MGAFIILISKLSFHSARNSLTLGSYFFFVYLFTLVACNNKSRYMQKKSNKRFHWVHVWLDWLTVG